MHIIEQPWRITISDISVWATGEDYLHHRSAARAELAAVEGDLKRLAMARALATGPDLLLDEPFAGLSTSEIEVLSNTIRQLSADGVTLVIVKHKIGSLLALVDRVIAMDQGKVIADGEPQSVMRDPAVVTAYLGGEAPAGDDDDD